MSRIVVELVNDREARSHIQRILTQQSKANDEEHERLSERDIRRMICQSIQSENPRLSSAAIERLLERRWTAAMQPYRGSLSVSKKSPTARDLYRAERRATVRRGREGRR